MTAQRALPSLLAITALCLSTSAARAEDPVIAAPPRASMIVLDSVSPAAAPSPKRWYGWQALTAVAVSDTLAIAGGFLAIHGSLRIFSDKPVNYAETGAGATMAILGIGGHLFSGPIIHLAHGQKATAGYSLLANLGLPLVGGLIGAGIGQAAAGSARFGSEDITQGAMAGIIAGGVSATILDVAVLSHEPRRAARAGGAKAPSLAVAPVIAPGHTALGVAGRF